MSGPPVPRDARAQPFFAGKAVRTLHAVQMRHGHLTEPVGATTVIAVLDTETTGLDATADVIVELAIRRVRVDETGTIVEIGRGRTWIEDPGKPLEPAVARLTKLTQSDLAGQRLDDELATGMLASADWICAHNSRFDRPFVEARLPRAAGGRWCCSCTDVDWSARGFEGRGLGWLLSQAGLCHAGHRALNDVDATIALLASAPGERPALAELVANAAAPAWVITAVGANYGVKDLLRQRGYRWCARDRAWRREVPDKDRLAEEFWLADHVYNGGARPQALGPLIEAADPNTRFLT